MNMPYPIENADTLQDPEEGLHNYLFTIILKNQKEKIACSYRYESRQKCGREQFAKSLQADKKGLGANAPSP